MTIYRDLFTVYFICSCFGMTGEIYPKQPKNLSEARAIIGWANATMQAFKEAHPDYSSSSEDEVDR
jgi:hypothetical protein